MSSRRRDTARQSAANPSPCYLTNIRVFFENNSELAAKIVKKTCGAGVSLILRNFDIREEQGAAHCRLHRGSIERTERRLKNASGSGGAGWLGREGGHPACYRPGRNREHRSA